MAPASLDGGISSGLRLAVRLLFCAVSRAGVLRGKSLPKCGVFGVNRLRDLPGARLGIGMTG